MAIGGGAAVGAVKSARAAAAGKTGVEAVKASVKSIAGFDGAAQTANVAKSGLGKVADIGRKTLDKLGDLSQAAESASKAVGKLSSGDWAGAAKNAFDAVKALGLPIKGKNKAGHGDGNLGAHSGRSSGSGTPSNAPKGPPREGIYEFPDTTGGNVPYVGQSGNIPGRLSQHQGKGRLVPGTETTTEVLDGKTAREIAKHNRIQELTGSQKAKNSPNVTNQRDPIGPNRRPGLGLPEPRD